MKNKKYIAYIRKNTALIPQSAISLELENKIKNFIEVRPFIIDTKQDTIKIEGLEFKSEECPIIFVGKNHYHGLSYDIFEEYLKQKNPEKVIIDLRDYHSDSFEEDTGKSWSWVKRLVKDYSKRIQIRVYSCKESPENIKTNKIIISSNLPKKEEFKKLIQDSKQRIVASLDLDFLYLNKFEEKDFFKIIKSLDYPRDYMDIYFFNSDKKTEFLQNNFIILFLEYLTKN